ncbi:MAG: hypothetical protein OXI69_17660 [Acidobacteriota bacterium]|nr:hypothetical protein [Acidobacteriota bacterium]
MTRAAKNGLQASDKFAPPSLRSTLFLPETLDSQHRPALPANAMIALRLTFILFILLWTLTQELKAQSLTEVASKERGRRAQLPHAAVIHTNETLQAHASRLAVSSSTRAAPAVSPRRPSRPADLSGTTREERGWSRRFLQAKARLATAEQRHQALRAKLEGLNLKLQGDPFRQTTVTDPARVYGPLIAQAEQRIEQRRQVLSRARRELADLRERLRKSGKPLSWEHSRAALDHRIGEGTADGTEGPVLRDRAYWQRQLSLVDQRFRSRIAPLELERFQLVHRRIPQKGEALEVDSTPGLGLPPGVADINRRIRQLRSRKTEEKRALVGHALRSGALPGWFR